MTDLNLEQFPVEVQAALLVLEEHGWEVKVKRERGFLITGSSILRAHYPTMQQPEPAPVHESWTVVRGWRQVDG